MKNYKLLQTASDRPIPKRREGGIALKLEAAFALISLSLPVCAQELWMFGEPNRTYGIWRFTGNPEKSTNYSEMRVGHIEVRKQSSTFEGKPCLLFSSTAFFSPKALVQGIIPPPTLRHYDVWTKPDGTVLRVFMQYTAFRKQVVTDSVFKDDRIEMTVNEDGKERKAALFPAEGTKCFANPFLDLMATAEKDRRWVPLFSLEASTSGIVRYRARVTGRFKYLTPTLKFEGRVIEVVGPGKAETYKLFITVEGQLIEANLPDGRILSAQEFPILPTVEKPGRGGEPALRT